MCGIAGFISFYPDDVKDEVHVLDRMVRVLEHRGPDGGGCLGVEAGNGLIRTWRPAEETRDCGVLRVGLANRRLKIIDLSPAGHQPMSNEDGTVWLVHNGEVYNYRELRPELEARGHVFRSQTDTEVVIHAYEEYGPACVQRFNGMWAFALYDLREGSLLLSRDRFGIKPLYFYRDDQRLIFASEIKSLLRHPAVHRTPNYRTIYNYVARNYRWVDGGRETFFDGIEQVLAAHTLHIAADGTITERRYWALDPAHRREPDSEEATIAEFRDLFADAVRLRLRSDVSLACTLSGGMDSTSVTCMAARLTGAPVTTFSARYDGGPYDEGPFIQATVDHVKADARFIYPRPADLSETVDTMLAYHDEPVCTVTWYSHWLVMREVGHQGFPVLLNGHGGDELLAGYWDHYHWNFADLRAAGDARGLAHELEQWRERHQRDSQEYDRYVGLIARLKSGATTEAAEGTPYAFCVTPDFRAQYETTPARPCPYTGYLDRRLHQELIYETLPAALRPEDRNTMAFSIESRSPFLDYRLVEFCFSLPNRFKIRDGISKWLLREAMRGILPEAVRLRREKVGFNAPSTDWFRADNRSQLLDLFLSPSFANRGLLDVEAVLRTFDDHLAGRANHYQAIWQWMNLELWFRRFFDGGAK